MPLTRPSRGLVPVYRLDLLTRRIPVQATVAEGGSAPSSAVDDGLRRFRSTALVAVTTLSGGTSLATTAPDGHPGTDQDAVTEGDSSIVEEEASLIDEHALAKRCSQRPRVILIAAGRKRFRTISLQEAEAEARGLTLPV